MFRLTIKTDNTAFDVGEPGEECARILREVAKKLEEGHINGPTMDYNGNIVGSFKLT